MGLPAAPPAALTGALPPPAVGDTGLPGRGAALPTEGEMGRIVGECEARGRGLLPLGPACAGACCGGGMLVVAPGPAGTSILFPILLLGLGSCFGVGGSRGGDGDDKSAVG